MRTFRRTTPLFGILVLLSSITLFLGCTQDDKDNIDNPKEPTLPIEGQSDFVSAANDQGYGQEGRSDDLAGAPEDATDDGDGDGSGTEERSVEEGDIYRLLGDGLILNLNSFRGLQVIDFNDLENPKIIGRSEVSGYPVELYVYENYAFVLMNDWHGYYSNRFHSNLEALHGGILISVDISDPRAPRVTDKVFVPGSITTSRLVHGGGQAAIYIATGEYSYDVDDDGQWRNHLQTYVRSFEMEEGAIHARSEIDLGGYVSDIQATSRALLVARNERWWSSGDQPSRVSVIDISSPDGTMIEGDDVEVAGFVFTQFNMDLYNDVLRVVSGSRWGSSPTNFIQTFDAKDLSNITLIDQEEFGEGEDLYATLFLGNKAFFVTYWQVDPFHAFEITDEGIATEMSEFIVSGWNDYFRPVFNEKRLIGIGKNDEQGNQQAVSLYDITDLTNPDPLLARAEVDMQWSWSEAQWDHRAFSVLQNAVDVTTEDGVQETGLVLLPFSGWGDDNNDHRYMTAVQIFTFSENTLTRRGVMRHPSQVRRSFLANDDAIANLSETDLAFFDHTDPDNPEQLGSVELAPNYSDFFLFGEHGVRRKDTGNSYWYYHYDSDAESVIEILPKDADPDLSEAIASFEIDSRSMVLQAGNLLVSISNQGYDYFDYYRDSAQDQNGDSNSPSLKVYDLSDPANPELASVTDISDLFSDQSYWSNQQSLVVGDGLAFVKQDHKYEIIGTTLRCYTDYYDVCNPDGECSRVEDSDLDCERNESGEIVCTGSLRVCSRENGEWACQQVDISDIPNYHDLVYCYDRDEYRYWTEFSVRTIDLSDPSTPIISSEIISESELQIRTLVNEEDLYLIFSRPVTVDNDDRSYAKWFFQRIDLSSYDSPQVHQPVNVPGVLLGVDGDYVYTADFVYNDNNIETAVAKSEVSDGLAYLRGIHLFEDRRVDAIELDAQGNVLVTHGQAYWWNRHDGPVSSSPDGMDGTVSHDYDSDTSELYKLTILDGQSDDLVVLGEADVERWATLQDVKLGRALFSVPGGLVVMNLDDPSQPYPQAFFATRGWPRSIQILGEDVVMAAGRHGIYQFTLDTFNLLTDN